MYILKFNNGLTLNNVEMIDGQFNCHTELTQEMLSGIKRVTIKSTEGFSKEIKRARVVVLGKMSGTWRFSIKELTKEEKREESRKKKISDQNAWLKANYDRVSVILPKGTKEKISNLGYSTNSFINEAVLAMLDRATANTVD